MPSWVVIIGFFLTGGIGVKVFDQLVEGWRERNRARGVRDGSTDALHRSRLWWIERAYQARRVAIEKGGDLPPFDDTHDPWIVWQTTVGGTTPTMIE